MSKYRFCFVLAVVGCLALPSVALSIPPGSQLPDTVDRAAFGALDQSATVGQPVQAAQPAAPWYIVPSAPSAGTAIEDAVHRTDPRLEQALAEARPAAVAQPAAAAAPIVYLVQQPAAAPAQTSSGGAVAIGILGAIPGEVWGALLGIIATLVFSFWKGSAASKARDVVLQLAEGAWYVAEKNGGPGAQKFADACDSFYKAITGVGLKLDAKTIALRDSTFTAMSAADKLARQRALEEEIRLEARAKAEAEPKPESAGALLAEAAKA